MIIGIDGNEANIENRVGVGQYAYNLLLSLYKLDSKNQYIIYLKNPPLKDLPISKPNWQYRVFGPQKLWTKFALPLRLYTQKEKLNLFFSLSHYSPSFSPFPTIPTIHDLGYLQYQDQFTKKDLYQLINWTKQSIKKAAHIITVSNFSKKEIEKTYNINPEKISVAFNGVGEIPKISQIDCEKVLSKFQITKPYFLYLGTLKPNKNIPFLIKSFSLYLRSNIDDRRSKLVIAGKKGWLFQEIFETVKKEKTENNVIFTDYINELEKWFLYKNAIALVIPSLYEGFGIPALEAMKSGTPVIASSIDSLKEVVENSGLLIDPLNNQDLIDKMIKISDPKIREKYSVLGLKQAQKFTWDNTAKSVLDVFNKFSSKKNI
jgi:glycosyltransferase involved in cell wall biosynthesis